MGDYLIRMPGTLDTCVGFGRFRLEIVGFLAQALGAGQTSVFIASPYWSKPNLILKAAMTAATWKWCLADTKIVVAERAAARRVVNDLRRFRPWSPSVFVCAGLHAKLVLVEEKEVVRALLGSANMTAAGLRRRLEAMVQLDFTRSGARGCGLLSLRDAILLRSVRFEETKEAI